MDIEPDVKDWTWVIDGRCPDCGFDASVVGVDEVPRLLREIADQFAGLLVSGADLTVRPDAGTWSPLEYGCHVRDCVVVFAERLQLMLTHDDPPFPNWDQDAAAVEGRYNGQDPAVVAAELRSAAADLADGFANVRGAQWGRTGRRSNGSFFTVETLARYFIHDPIHHWWDVSGQGVG